MRIALVILLVLHGIAHMPGFLASWQLMTSQDVPYKTTILNGLIDLGDGGIKLFGLLWVVAMLAFLAAAWMLYIGSVAKIGCLGSLILLGASITR